jgi:hypothetical protein
MKPGWQMINGAARHELHPKTFYVPDAASRRSLQVGDYVKLGVEKCHEDEPFSGERFWVVVTQRDAVFATVRYKGRVEQADMFDGDRHGVTHDSEIEFGPQNVLDSVRKAM